jgi:hypothetical protein
LYDFQETRGGFARNPAAEVFANKELARADNLMSALKALKMVTGQRNSEGTQRRASFQAVSGNQTAKKPYQFDRKKQFGGSCP